MATNTALERMQHGLAERELRAELDRAPELRSVHTRRAYLMHLLAFESWRHGQPISKRLVEDYAAECQRSGAMPSTINARLAAVRWLARRFMDLAFEQVAPDTEPERTAFIARRSDLVEQAARVASVKDVKGEFAIVGPDSTPDDSEPVGRQLSDGELRALLNACTTDPTPSGARDSALIALAWVTGMRRAELCDLRYSSLIERKPGELRVVIKGKGAKVRKLKVTNGALEYLNDWLTIRGGAPGPLFTAINKGGKQPMGTKGELQGITENGLAKMLAKRTTGAGITERTTWHDFRRTFASNLLAAAVDLVTVQHLLGHSSPVTTAAYDRRGQETKDKALQALHVPYLKKAV